MSNDASLDYWQLIESIWDDPHLNSDSAETYLERFSELTEPQKVLFPTHWLCSEILNGGFHQCFSNTTGLYAPEAVDGFKILGLDATVAAVRSAIDVFERPFPREREKRIEFLDLFQGEKVEERNPFFAIDDQFYDSIAPVDGTSWEYDRYVEAVGIYVRRFFV